MSWRGARGRILRGAWRAGVGGLSLAVLASCGASKSNPALKNIGQVELTPLSQASTPKRANRVVDGLAAHVVALIGQKSIGPFYARGTRGGLVAWIGTGDNGGRRLLAAAVSPRGEGIGDVRALTNVPNETTSLVVRSGGDRPGFFALWTSLLDRGEALMVAGIAPDGTLRGPPVEITRTHDHLLWSEVIPTSRGAVCLWAEETRARDANVLAVTLEVDGKPRGLPVRVARGVTGWQAIPAAGGIGLALATAARDRGSSQGGSTLSWLRLDAEGRPTGNPIPITSKPTVGTDMDVVPVDGRYVFAWTDKTGEDPEVVLASIDDAGKVLGPRKVVTALGGAALVGIRSGKAGALLAWDEPSRRSRPNRSVHLAQIGSSGDLTTQEVLAVEVQGGAPPEIVGTDNGFALLFHARACAARPAGERCPANAPIVPTYLRLDEKLTPVDVQPLRLGDSREIPTLAWGLDCKDEPCLALAAAGSGPAQINVVEMVSQATGYHPPVIPPPPPDAPRVSLLKTVATGAPYAQVDATAMGDATLLATLTTELPSGRREVGALLEVRVLGPDGALRHGPTLLTNRALAVGGVAIAAGGGPEDGAAIAWVARDGGVPQVHVTRVDRRGRRQNEVQLTTARGDVAHVAIAWADGGWIVAWVDARDGNGEVYITKIGTDLQRVAREERLTNAPGDAGDVTLLPRGDKVFVAWADAQDSPRDGLADIYATTVRARDVAHQPDAFQVLATASHSRSPSLVGLDDGVAIAWIEESPMGLDAPNAGIHGAMLTRLDDEARPTHDPIRVPLSRDGYPTVVRLEAGRSVVRAYAVRSGREELALDAVEIPADLSSPGRPFTLVPLDGPPSLDISLAIAGGALYFDDGALGAESTPGDRRVRRATVVWKR